MAAGQDADMAKLIKILTDEAPLHTKLLEAMVRRFERGGHSVAAAPSESERQMEAAKAAAIEAFKAVKANPSDANKAALQNAEAAYYVAISDLVEDAPEDEKEFQRYILGKLKLSAIDVTGQVAAGGAAAAAAPAPAPVEGAGGNAPVAPAGGNAPVEGAAPVAPAGGNAPVAPAAHVDGAGGNAADANPGNDGNANSVLTSASDAESAAGSGEPNDASVAESAAGSGEPNDASVAESAAGSGEPNDNDASVAESAAGSGEPNDNDASVVTSASAMTGPAFASSGGSEDSMPELERTDLEIATVDSLEDLTAKYENTCAGIQEIIPDGLCFYRAILTGLKEDASTEKSKEFAVQISDWLKGNKETIIPITNQLIKDAYGPVRNLSQHKAQGNSSRKDFNFDEYIAATIDFQGDSPNVYPELEVSGWAAANVKKINLIVYANNGVIKQIYTPFDGIKNKPVIKIKENGGQNHFDLCLHDPVNSAGGSGAGSAASNAGEVDEDNAQGSAISGMFGTNNNSVTYRSGSSESAAPSPPAPPPGPPPNPPRGVLPPPLPGKPLGPASATAAPPPPVAAEPPLPPAAKDIFDKNPESIKRLKIEQYDTIEKYNEKFQELFIEQMKILKDYKRATSKAGNIIIDKDNVDDLKNKLADAEFLKKILETNGQPLPLIPGTEIDKKLKLLHDNIERIQTQSGGAKAKAKSRAVTPIGKRLDISLKKRSKTSKKSKSKKTKSPKTRKSKH